MIMFLFRLDLSHSPKPGARLFFKNQCIGGSTYLFQCFLYLQHHRVGTAYIEVFSEIVDFGFQKLFINSPSIVNAILLTGYGKERVLAQDGFQFRSQDNILIAFVGEEQLLPATFPSRFRVLRIAIKGVIPAPPAIK